MSIPSVRSVPAESFLLDVREDDEWAAGRAPGAVHIPLAELAGRVGEVPTGMHVVAICRSGGRSAKATEFLRERGVDAHNYDGGMRAYLQAGLPMVTDLPDGARVI